MSSTHGPRSNDPEPAANDGHVRRHDGIVVADGDHVEGDLPVRSPSAGIAAVQQIALTTWDPATLLKRVWGFDALTCTGCGGRMRFIAVIKDRAVIEVILKHIGEDAEVRRGERSLRPVGVRAGEHARRAGRAGGLRPSAARGGGWIRSAWRRSRREVPARRRGGPRWTRPRVSSVATSWRTAMDAAARVVGSDDVAGRGDRGRGGRGRAGRGVAGGEVDGGAAPCERRGVNLLASLLGEQPQSLYGWPAREADLEGGVHRALRPAP